MRQLRGVAASQGALGHGSDGQTGNQRCRIVCRGGHFSANLYRCVSSEGMLRSDGEKLLGKKR